VEGTRGSICCEAKVLGEDIKLASRRGLSSFGVFVTIVEREPQPNMLDNMYKVYIGILTWWQHSDSSFPEVQ
jgi:hypothetical protein